MPNSSLRSVVALVFAAVGLMACSSPQPAPVASPSVAFAAQVPEGTVAPTVAACDGLDSRETRAGFFRDDRRAVQVEKVYGDQFIGARNKVQKPAGARIVVAATPGMTAQYLERVAHCHAESYRAGAQAAGDEPLGVKGAKVAVKEVHGGYAIEVTADDRDDANEIYSRATALRR